MVCIQAVSFLRIRLVGPVDSAPPELLLVADRSSVCVLRAGRHLPEHKLLGSDREEAVVENGDGGGQGEQNVILVQQATEHQNKKNERALRTWQRRVSYLSCLHLGAFSFLV